MIYRLGPRARRVYLALRDRIARGDWPPGTQLPAHRDLAIEFGVAPMTMRQVLAQLEEQGLVSRQPGRGTFVREASTPSIVVVEADSTMGAFLTEYVSRAGYRALTAGHQTIALAILGEDPAVVLVLCDIEASLPQEGIGSIRMLRSRWAHIPVVAIVADLQELGALFGTAEWPLHILPKPVNLGQLDELLHLVARRATG